MKKIKKEFVEISAAEQLQLIKAGVCIFEDTTPEKIIEDEVRSYLAQDPVNRVYIPEARLIYQIQESTDFFDFQIKYQQLLEKLLLWQASNDQLKSHIMIVQDILDLIKRREEDIEKKEIGLYEQHKQLIEGIEDLKFEQDLKTKELIETMNRNSLDQNAASKNNAIKIIEKVKEVSSSLDKSNDVLSEINERHRNNFWLSLGKK